MCTSQDFPAGYIMQPAAGPILQPIFKASCVFQCATQASTSACSDVIHARIETYTWHCCNHLAIQLSWKAWPQGNAWQLSLALSSSSSSSGTSAPKGSCPWPKLNGKWGTCMKPWGWPCACCHSQDHSYTFVQPANMPSKHCLDHYWTTRHKASYICASRGGLVSKNQNKSGHTPCHTHQSQAVRNNHTCCACWTPAEVISCSSSVSEEDEGLLSDAVPPD